jgi:DNA invertase Pin-like site-specific DNA recombinase
MSPFTTKESRMSTTMDGYIRVSRRAGRDGETYLSPKLQRKAIERWAEYTGVRIAKWHVDEDWSGGASSRPGLDDARQRCVDGKTGGIVSWKIDRFSRNTVHGLSDLKLLNDHNARLAFVVESVDTATDTGKFLYTILLAVAESFLDNVTQGWESTKLNAYERGTQVGRTPLGYARIADRDDPHVGSFVVDERGEHITEAFRLAAHESVRAACDHLAAHFPERRWGLPDARRLLAKRAYLGEIRLDADTTRMAHEPLTTPEIFAMAQTEARDYRLRGDYPLSKLLECERCGSHLTGQHVKRRAGKTERRYRCADKQCTTINADRIEGYVREVLTAALDVEEFRDVLSPDGLDDAQEALALAERNVIRWANDDTTRSAVGEDRYRAGLEDRVAARNDAQRTYDELVAQAGAVEVLPTIAQLDDLAHFTLASRLTIDRIVIRGGRAYGEIEDRVVRFAWHRHDLVAGALAA